MRQYDPRFNPVVTRRVKVKNLPANTGDFSEYDRFLAKLYFRNGPCCAGCDYWEHSSAAIGQCLKSAPVSGTERLGILKIEFCSLDLPAGHVFTPPKHFCGDFRDTFDWKSLPLVTRKEVGCHV